MVFCAKIITSKIDFYAIFPTYLYVRLAVYRNMDWMLPPTSLRQQQHFCHSSPSDNSLIIYSLEVVLEYHETKC